MLTPEKKASGLPKSVGVVRDNSHEFLCTELHFSPSNSCWDIQTGSERTSPLVWLKTQSLYFWKHNRKRAFLCVMFWCVIFIYSTLSLKAAVMMSCSLCNQWRPCGISSCWATVTTQTAAVDHQTTWWAPKHDEHTWWCSPWFCSLGSLAGGWSGGFGQRSNNNTEVNGNQVWKRGS